jgi:hypothetical protein
MRKKTRMCLPRAHSDHLDTGDVRLAASLPLPQCQVGDVGPGCCKSLGQVAIPTFGSADRVRVETVVDKGRRARPELSSMSNAVGRAEVFRER